MDTFLVDYLKSGKAWLLIGSGPSIEMGYPNWMQLARQTIELVKTESPTSSLIKMSRAFDAQDYPHVFEEAFSKLPSQQVLSHLQKLLLPQRITSKIYELIAKWPISVYMTTNYDDEIFNHLVKIGQAYLPYSNTKDNMALMYPSLSNAIYKLHGDLRSEDGLILTTSQYQAIDSSPDWQYWRTTMTSVFRMLPVIIIGYSLSDPHIKHILQAAKDGAGVNQPICWIAPEVSIQKAQELLLNYKIRVIPYDNQDGNHSNLVRRIENINQFVFSRTSIHIQKEIEDVTKPPLGSNASAPGYFVFNNSIVVF